MIIVHNDKKDENKVIGNAHIHAKVNTTKAKQYSVKLLVDINVVKVFLESIFLSLFRKLLWNVFSCCYRQPLRPLLVANWPLIGLKLNSWQLLNFYNKHICNIPEANRLMLKVKKGGFLIYCI